MSRVKLILTSNTNDIEFCSVNQRIACENVNLNVPNKINVDVEISSRLPNGLLGVNLYKTYESCWS